MDEAPSSAKGIFRVFHRFLQLVLCRERGIQGHPVGGGFSGQVCPQNPGRFAGALSQFAAALQLEFSEANAPFPADPAKGQGLQKAFHKGAHTIIVKGQDTV